ncbi:hypothetical protein Tco_0012319 [Tanacetum coccineum]
MSGAKKRKKVSELRSIIVDAPILSLPVGIEVFIDIDIPRQYFIHRMIMILGNGKENHYLVVYRFWVWKDDSEWELKEASNKGKIHLGVFHGHGMMPQRDMGSHQTRFGGILRTQRMQNSCFEHQFEAFYYSHLRKLRKQATNADDVDLIHEDLDQIDDLDLEEMDINWQIA